MKHHLRHLLPLALLLVTLLLAVCVSAADSDYLFTENADGTLTITGYAGSDNDLVIPAEINGKKVTTIGSRAFDCFAHEDQNQYIYLNITSIIVPEGITTFAVTPFGRLPILERVELPKSLRYEDIANVFDACFSLKEIVVADGNPTIVSVDNVLYSADMRTIYAYPHGKKDESYTIPEGVTTIGAYAFFNNSSLKQIILPESLTKMDYGAFGRIRQLETLYIAKNVSEIASNALYGCENIYSYTVDADNQWFAADDTGTLFTKDMTRLLNTPSFLESYSVPDAVTSIAGGAFTSSRLTLKAVHIPTSITEILDRSTFLLCDNIADIYFAGTEERWSILARDLDSSFLANVTVHFGGESGADITNGTCGYNTTWVLDAEGTLTISGTGEIYNNSYYQNQAPWFDYREQIVKIVVEEGITAIGACNFYSCTFLKEVSLPSTLLEIRSGAFRRCTQLSSILLPENLSMLDGSFWECFSLQTIEIPASVTSLSSATFVNCTSLTEIHVAEDNPNYCSVDGVVFNKDMTELLTLPANAPFTTYTVPDTVTSLCISSIRNCHNLTKIILPDSLTTISSCAFMDCTNLPSITIPKNVQYICDSFSDGCHSMTEILVDTDSSYYSSVDGVLFNKDQTVLHAYPPAKADTAYAVPDTVTEIQFNAFSDVRALVSITLPDSITTLNRPFAYCRNLAEIQLPQNLQVLNGLAFGCTSLTRVDIPASVASLGDRVFYLCDKLTSIYFYGDAPSTLDTTFSQTSPDLTLYYISGKSGWTSPTWNGYNTATFVPESKPTVPGDIDGNGTVDYFDVSALYAAYLSEEVDAEIMDINNDGVVDYYDVAKLYAAFRGTVSLGN